MGQVEQARQEVLLELGPAGDRGRSGGPREDGQDGDDQDAGQGVPSVDMGARILRAEKEVTIPPSLLRVLAIADLRPPDLDHDTVAGIPGRTSGEQDRKVYQIVIKVRAGPGATPRPVCPASRMVATSSTA